MNGNDGDDGDGDDDGDDRLRLIGSRFRPIVSGLPTACIRQSIIIL